MAAAAVEESRPLNETEGLWVATNGSSSPLAVVATLVGPVTVESIAAHLARAWKVHPYLRSCVDLKSARIVPSELSEFPLTHEVVDWSGKDALAEIRTATREQLLKGVNILEGFVRAHLLSESSSDRHHFVLLGDHMALDARSFFAVIECVMSSDDSAEPQPFVDWTERVPAVSKLDIDAGPPAASLAPSVASGTPVEKVRDLVWEMPEEQFVRLKTVTKEHSTTLNGPLLVAFSQALRTVSESGDKPVVASCAVDVRRSISPPLPADYVSSVAGLTNVSVETSGDPWESARKSRSDLVSAIAEGQPFRMVQLLKMGDHASLGKLFNVSFVWSNVGHYGGSTSAGGMSLDRLELHVMGDGSNPLISLHSIEVNHRLVMTLTFSPNFHSRETMERLLAEFQGEIARLCA
jgi:hypothetical protein